MTVILSPWTDARIPVRWSVGFHAQEMRMETRMILVMQLAGMV